MPGDALVVALAQLTLLTDAGGPTQATHIATNGAHRIAVAAVAVLFRAITGLGADGPNVAQPRVDACGVIFPRGFAGPIGNAIDRHEASLATIAVLSGLAPFHAARP